MMLILSLITLKNGIRLFQNQFVLRKDQPFYHLLAENDDITYEAYVSEQNLLPDDAAEPLRHPLVNQIFKGKKGNIYIKQYN